MPVTRANKRAKVESSVAKITSPTEAEPEVEATQRGSEFRAWWSLDKLLAKDEANHSGAVTLAKAFIEEVKVEGGDGAFQRAIKTLTGYLQFLTVKKLHADLDGTELCPPYLIDSMWRIHSQLPSYERDCQLFFGRSMQYSSGDDVDEDVMAARLQVTIDAVRARFSNVEESVWYGVCIGVDDSNGEDNVPCFYKKRTDPLSKALEDWAEDKGVSASDFLFFCDGKPVSASNTCESLGIVREADIDAVAKDDDLLRIIVRDQTGTESLYLHRKADILAFLLTRHAELAEVEKSSLVFLHNGKRIYGFETPSQSDLGQYDVIEVVPAESYKTERCICCNPAPDLFKVG